MRTRLYSLVVLAAAVITSALVVARYALTSLLPVLILIVLAYVTERMAFELSPGTEVSLSFAIVYAALLHSGPLAGILCALAISASKPYSHSKDRFFLAAFNVGQLSLASAASGLTYLLIGGVVIAESVGSHVNLIAGGFAAGVFYAVNVSLFTVFVAARNSQSLAEVISSQGYLSYGGSLVVLALLGIVIAELLALGSWAGLLLLVLPFMAARRTFRVYAELSEAYTATVRSLVTAIEAKDPYTKGHSERVAVYSRDLAGALGLPKSQIDLVERAALLHDVGKIGIPLDTLTSPAHLSSEEVRLIRQHPDVGSHLVSDVEFLSDIVPVIRHHHERVDGAGYPDGLIGEEIPVLSRLLSIADAYDAMTSSRAYRLAMSSDAAISELKRVSGTQLDKEMASQFIHLLDSKASEVSLGA